MTKLTLGMFTLLVLLTFAGMVPWFMWLIPIVGIATVIGLGMAGMGTWVADFTVPPVREDSDD
jgi:hypothetical protein